LMFCYSYEIAFSQSIALSDELTKGKQKTKFQNLAVIVIVRLSKFGWD
jgi:hypothetical protein